MLNDIKTVERKPNMKKVLSIVLALLMMFSVVSLTGCKKKQTTAELFVSAMEQLLTPEFMSDFAGEGIVDGANKFSLTVDELELDMDTLAGLMGEEIGELPSIYVEYVNDGAGYSGLSGEFSVGVDELAGRLDFIDGKVYLSVPNATDSYFAATVEDLVKKEQDESGEEAAEEMRSTLEGLSEGLGLLSGGAYTEELKEEYFTVENKVSAEVFGEETDGLKKITLELDKEAYSAVMSELDMSVSMNLTGESEEEISAVKIAVYLDGTSLKKAELEIKSENTVIDGYLDVDSGKTEHKLEGKFDVTAEGEELATIDVESDIKLDGDKISGETIVKPVINLPEDAEETMGIDTVTLRMLENLKITAEYDGELGDDTLDMNVDLELTLGVFAIKLPLEYKYTIEDDKYTCKFSCESSIMGMIDFKIGAEYVMENVSDIERPEYDEADSIGIDDEDVLDSFSSEIREYIAGLEDLSALLEGFENGGEITDETSEILFNVYDDEIDMYFYSDGTGVMSSEYDADIDGDTITLSEEGEEIGVITMKADGSANVMGMVYEWAVDDCGENGKIYCFTSLAEPLVEIYVYEFDMSAIIGEYFSYTIDESALTIDGAALEYEIDEANGIIKLNGVEYYYVSYAE